MMYKTPAKLDESPLSVYRRLHTGKLQCRAATRALIEARFLIRGQCEMEGPGCKGRVEAHHDDYTNPWNVRWLCVHHHRWVDRGKTGAKRRLTDDQRRENHRLRVARYRAQQKAKGVA